MSSSDNLKVTIETFDEPRNRKDSLLTLNPSNLKIENEDHHHEIINSND
jgi:hypothetical protein